MAAIRPSIQRGGALSFVWMAAVLLVFSPESIRASDLDACEPSPDVRAALDRLPASRGTTQTVRQFREEKLARIQALIRRFPDDLFIERLYIGMVAPTPDRDSVIQEYKSRLERSPDDPRLAYNSGLTLYSRHTPEAIKAFETAIEKAPRFPWPRLALVDVYSSPRYRDPEKAVSNLKAFIGLCPSSLQGYIATAKTADPDLIREAAQALRRMLPSRRDAEALDAYASLWSLEFKSRPASEHDQLRKQVVLDLKRLRALGLKETRQWYGALREGYELVDDRKGSDWASRESDRRFPMAWDVPARQVWSRDHPYPNPNDPPEAQQAYHHARLKESEKWVKERPNSTLLWSIRLGEIQQLDDVPVLEIETAVEGMLKAIEASAGVWGSGYSNLFDVARTLSEKDLQPERVVELARKGLERIELESHEWQSDLSVRDESDDFYERFDFV